MHTNFLFLFFFFYFFSYSYATIGIIHMKCSSLVLPVILFFLFWTGAFDFMYSTMGLGVFITKAGPNRFMLHQAANDGFRGIFLVCF